MIPFPVDGLELRCWRERAYWAMAVRVRRGEDGWSDADTYTHLTRSELQDVLDELPAALGRLGSHQD